MTSVIARAKPEAIQGWKSGLLRSARNDAEDASFLIWIKK